ncbi:MAG: stage V sporulation protein D [Thermoclostridium sp.]|nr:stage V sporulation protein D [Thermoclostridium sp.]
MRKGRIRLLLFVLTVSMGLMGYKLYKIQIIQHDTYSASAFRQRSKMTEIYQERGEILDRNMISFTGRSTEFVAVLQPAVFPKEQQTREYIADLLGVEAEEFINFSVYNAAPLIYPVPVQTAQIFVDNPLPGVSIVERRKRMEANMPGAHLIGYTDGSCSQGLAGIEKAFQDVLSSGSSVYALATTDARDEYLQEFGYQIRRTKADSPLSMKLTLDFHMQKLAEEVMDNMMVSGAVVMIDILTGDVLVLASRPGFNPSDISRYLDDETQPLFNRAIAGYTPGSIFKIISTAAALEEHYNPEITYECTGFFTVGEQAFKCWTFDTGGHGTVDLKDSFAQSCNGYFIQLGIELGPEKMLQTAKSFGLGAVTGLEMQKLPEYEGLLPKLTELDGDGNVANLAMGQGKILVTPLQAAGMAAIIANGGIRNTFNILDCIVNREGEIIRDLKTRQWQRVISRETATALMEMMEATVENGTGQKADIGGYGGAAGKTGSAETGLFEGDRRILHAWFTGYFPYVEPRYAMCVFVEDGTGGGTSAAPVFAEIAARIMQWEEMH